MSGEMKAAFRLVWFALSLVTGAAVLAPFVLPEPVIQRITPVCESKRRFGRACFLCGTTAGFVAISHGRFEDAKQSNQLALPLFALFSTNAAAAIAYVLRRARIR